MRAVAIGVGIVRWCGGGEGEMLCIVAGTGPQPDGSLAKGDRALPGNDAGADRMTKAGVRAECVREGGRGGSVGEKPPTSGSSGCDG